MGATKKLFTSLREVGSIEKNFKLENLEYGISKRKNRKSKIGNQRT